MVEFISAFVAGMLCFFTPCVFPVAIGFFGAISGINSKQIFSHNKKIHHKLEITTLLFVLGFSTAFSILGAGVFYVSDMFAKYADYINITAGIIVIIFGLHILRIIDLKFLDKDEHFNYRKIHSGYFGAFAIGFLFAIGWSPCIGPILASILAMAITKESALKASALLFTFSLGLGIPFIVISFFGNKAYSYFRHHSGFVKYSQKMIGLMLVGLGFYLILTVF
ncbi:MAG: hypothetical protein HOF38_01205 [Elusimicrobiaceae bacterium]|jgi:cytochrome c-type biogenesis protein|nr:hypothetical protein [Elusimicrobiaceae bacterium]MBT3954769.1 hypothetical protein [Elusimicrobiaceae bacterium]MBT4008247.1 hypothetical protein [Elusimicrobiaceae bacterium]MBT4403335.1 hypothetical protein [Elusimicrobiaceae bacterium]MBT4439822.1 hypothetical protein [Elusimicrobiaceae bacterium]